MPCLLRVLEVFIKVLENLETGGTLMLHQLLPSLHYLRLLYHRQPLLFLLLLSLQSLHSQSDLLQLQLLLLFLLLPPQLILFSLPLLHFLLPSLFPLHVLLQLLDSWIPLLHETHQILDGSDVSLPLLGPLCLVLLFHLSPLVPVLPLLQVVLVSPAEVFESAEGLPLPIELLQVLHLDLGVSEPRELPEVHLLLLLLLVFLVQLGPLVSLPFFLLDQLEYLPVNRIEVPRVISELLEALGVHVLVDIEPEGLHVELLCGHLVLVKQNLLLVVVIPSPLIDIRQNLIGLLDLHELLLGIRVLGLVWVELEGQLLVTRFDLGSCGCINNVQDLIVATLPGLDLGLSSGFFLGVILSLSVDFLSCLHLLIIDY